MGTQYYYVDDNNQQQGPFSFDQLCSIGLKSDTLIWKEGLSNWTPANEVEEVKKLINRTKPKPPQPVYAPQPVYSPPPKRNDIGKKFIWVAVVAAIAVILVIVLKNNIIGGGGSGSSIIKLKVESAGSVGLSLTGTGNVSIDWGDGSPKRTHVLTGVNKDEYFKHEYYDAKVRTITINGEWITKFRSDNQPIFTSLEVIRSPSLAEISIGASDTYFSGYKSNLTNLNVREAPALMGLYCSGKLTILDVSRNTSLTYLHCSSNQLTSLDVSRNTALTYLHCAENQLTSLDVSRNTALTHLNCSSNQLTSLNVSTNTALRHLDCSSNQFDVAALNALFHTLHSERNYNNLYIWLIPDARNSNFEIAKQKGWIVNDSPLGPW